MALAREIRDFYPPEMLWPISPSFVWSPLGIAVKSSSKQQAQHTFSYLCLSFLRPKRIFYSAVPVTIRGSYSASTISFDFYIKSVPDSIGISPRIAIKRDVFPEPTVPITANFYPCVSLRFRFLSTSCYLASSSESIFSSVNSSDGDYHEAETS